MSWERINSCITKFTDDDQKFAKTIIIYALLLRNGHQIVCDVLIISNNEGERREYLQN